MTGRRRPPDRHLDRYRQLPEEVFAAAERAHGNRVALTAELANAVAMPPGFVMPSAWPSAHGRREGR